MTVSSSRAKAWAEIWSQLEARGQFRMDLSLDRIERVLDNMGRVRPATALVQVCGTNGKGSTAGYLAALAKAHGLRVGLFLSPHLVSMRERVRVDGARLHRKDWMDLSKRVMAVRGSTELTYFEFVTALAVLAFERAAVDLAVMETGLGGTYDAVTAIAKAAGDLVLYTPIALDHQEHLGPDVASIARDKAGAVSPGGIALSGPQSSEAAGALTETIGRAGGFLDWAGALPEALADAPKAALGPHQRDNFALAWTAWKRLCPRLHLVPSLEAGAKVLAETQFTGRMQVVPGEPGRRPDVVLDGGHNPHGMAALHRALDAEGLRPAAVVFACLDDKDLDEIAPLALGMTDGPVFTPGLPGLSRARPAEELAAALGPCARAAANPAEALDAAMGVALDAGGPVLVCGSLYLLAACYALHPSWMAEPPDFRLPPEP